MDYRELRSALTNKGHAEEDRAKDHAFYYIEVAGKSYRATKISHGAHGQIDPGFLATMARQMRLTSRQIREFVACRLRRDGWLDIWRAGGHDSDDHPSAMGSMTRSVTVASARARCRSPEDRSGAGRPSGVYRNSGAKTRATMDISLIRMFSEGPEVSLKGSPTVSPTTAAAWGAEPLPP